MKSKLILALVCVITALLGAAAIFGIGEGRILGVQNINLGLDLRGGVTILYEADIPAPSGAEMNAATTMLQRRLDARGYTEATIAQEGARQLRVNIPGVEDPESAVREIGATALLTFRSEEGEVLVTGANVSRAQTGIDGSAPGGGQIVVNLEFDSTGTQLFSDATRANIGRPIHIFMDEEWISGPTVNSHIPDGRAVISGGGVGGFSRQEADDLSNTINAGSLPFGLTVASMNSIGAQLGAEALQSSIMAGIIGIILLMLTLFVIYKFAGLAANIALILYSAILLSIMSLLGITLTLPGIAGIILSVGMAVDANVIIFERIREEVAAGRSLRSALKAGYKRAFPAIVDCNITTFIAAIALFWQGTGPIQGFAVTLSLGILVSMFTALVITKLLLEGFFALGLSNPRLCGIPSPEDAKPARIFPIVENRKKYIMISAAVVLVGAIFAGVNAARGVGAFNLDVEFAGGTSFQIEMGQPFENDDLARIVTEVTGQANPHIQPVLDAESVIIRVHSLDDEAEEAAMRTSVMEAISEYYGLTPEAFTYATVSPTVSADMQRAAVIAVAVACLLMLIYITFRFRDVRMGASVVINLLHDAVMVMAVYAILRIPLSHSFIAVLLTTIGYSINAAIIIFDRIRENRGKLKGDAVELVNVSVSQTLRRSIITSASTMIAVVALFVLGVPSIRDFTLPIMIGLVFGTYSSVCLAGSTWFMLKPKKAE